MHSSADWRPHIAQVVEAIWPALDHGPMWIEAQVQVESAGNPRAISPVGAQGLLQLMPGTARDLGVADPLNPIENLTGGVRYLKQQYDRFPEIPEHFDRLRWAFAAYNGGRGYCNIALSLAERDDARNWTRWDFGRMWLMHRDCKVRHRFPDYRQIWDYVARITRAFRARTELGG